MRKLGIALLFAAVLFSGCGDSNTDVISIRLSLHETEYGDKHYLCVEVVNRSAERVFVPHMSAPFKVLQEGMDITRLFYTTYSSFGPCYDVSVRKDADSLELRYTDTYFRFLDSVRICEEEAFLRFNPSLNSLDMNTRAELNAVLRFKYDGFPLEARDTVTCYYSLGGLYGRNAVKPLLNCEIDFLRTDRFCPFSDTLKIGSNRYYTPLPEKVAGYRVYKGELKCNDRVYLRKG